MRVGSRLAKSRFEKHLHACIVANHVVLSTVANLIWVDALQTCLGRLEIQSQLRCAVRGKGATSEPQCTTKAGIQRLSLMCKIQKYCQSGKNAGVEFSRKWHPKLGPKMPAITTPHTFGNVLQKWSNKIKIQTNFKTPFLKTAAKLLTTEIHSLHVDTAPG